VTNLQPLALLALQISVFCTVFGFGLKTRLDDVSILWRRPALLARSFVAVFVMMPIVAVLLTRLFDFRPAVEIVLIALAISPVPPLLPQKQSQAGAETHYALGMMATFGLLAIVMVPLALEILARVSGRPLAIDPVVVARIVLTSTVLPLAAGMVARAIAPRLAAKIESPIMLAAQIWLVVAALALIVITARGIWAWVGDGTIIAMVLFLAAGFAIGIAMAGPDSDHALVLALATAYRHPAIAFSIASANFPEERFGGAILLYLIVGAIVYLPYVVWQRRRLQRRVARLTRTPG
jgi:bile acid:Na+ symporter, BASS family